MNNNETATPDQDNVMPEPPSVISKDIPELPAATLDAANPPEPVAAEDGDDDDFSFSSHRHDNAAAQPPELDDAPLAEQSPAPAATPPAETSTILPLDLSEPGSCHNDELAAQAALETLTGEEGPVSSRIPTPHSDLPETPDVPAQADEGTVYIHANGIGGTPDDGQRRHSEPTERFSAVSHSSGKLPKVEPEAAVRDHSGTDGVDSAYEDVRYGAHSRIVLEGAATTDPTSLSQADFDVRYMRLALEQARLAEDIGEVPIGAVVVCDNEVISSGYNRREIDRNPAGHAETIAMLEACRRLARWRLTGCTVYVTIEPCVMCAGLMWQARIDRCVYGAPDPKGGALGSLYDIAGDERLNHSFQVTSGVLADECSRLMRDFFASLRRKR